MSLVNVDLGLLLLQKKVKVETSSGNVGVFTSMAGDPNMLALGSMAMRPPSASNQNTSLAYGTGLPMNLAGQPMLGMGLSGTSPGFHTMGQHLSHLYGYGPGSVMPHNLPTNSGDGTPDANRSNKDVGIEGHNGGDRQSKPISGMTPPLMFAAPASGMLANGQILARAPAGLDVNYPTVLQVVSTDSQNDHGGKVTTQMAMVPVGSVVPLQDPKKWVRWSDHEDLILRKSVEQFGENNYRLISERVFHGTRTEVQCKNRWKKVSGLLSKLVLFVSRKEIIVLFVFCVWIAFRRSNRD